MLSLSASTLPCQSRFECMSRLGIGLHSSHNFRTYTRLTNPVSVAVKRHGQEIRVLKIVSMVPLHDVSGFGSQRTEGKVKHKILTLDPAKVEQVQTFDLFARRFVENGSAAKWERVGEILLEKETDLEAALKERRKKLLAAAQFQYPSLLMLNAGEEVQYGYRKSGDESNEAEIVVVDVKGKDLESSIPAILRAEDGAKPPPPRRFKRQ